MSMCKRTSELPGICLRLCVWMRDKLNETNKTQFCVFACVLCYDWRDSTLNTSGFRIQHRDNRVFEKRDSLASKLSDSAVRSRIRQNSMRFFFYCFCFGMIYIWLKPYHLCNCWRAFCVAADDRMWASEIQWNSTQYNFFVVVVCLPVWCCERVMVHFPPIYFVWNFSVILVGLFVFVFVACLCAISFKYFIFFFFALLSLSLFLVAVMEFWSMCDTYTQTHTADVQNIRGGRIFWCGEGLCD